MKSWINCDLLVIDEFGEGDIAVNSNWADDDRARISKIIDGRYQNGKPIIFTSNFDREQFFARLGARALDISHIDKKIKAVNDLGKAMAASLLNF